MGKGPHFASSYQMDSLVSGKILARRLKEMVLCGNRILAKVFAATLSFNSIFLCKLQSS